MTYMNLLTVGTITTTQSVNDPELNIYGGYKVNGAQIGSNIRIYGTGSQRLSNSSPGDDVLLRGGATIIGNAFSHAKAESNFGFIRCNYAGTIAVQANVYWDSSYTANDKLHFILWNRTTNAPISNMVNFRTPFQAPQTNTVSPVAYAQVSAGDNIKIRAYNETGARGTIDLSVTELFAQYLAPIL